MLDEEQTEQQLELLHAWRQNLAFYVRQQASQGGVRFALPIIASAIQEARNSIEQVKIALRAEGIFVEDRREDDNSPGKENIDWKLKLLTNERNKLAALLKEPFPRSDAIASSRSKIWNIKATLRSWGVSIENDTNEDEAGDTPEPETIETSQALLSERRRRLYHYFNALKSHGGAKYTPYSIISTIEDLIKDIRYNKGELRNWGISIADDIEEDIKPEHLIPPTILDKNYLNSGKNFAILVGVNTY